MMTRNRPRSVFGTRTGKSAILGFWASILVGLGVPAIDSVGTWNKWSQKDISNATQALLFIGSLCGVGGAAGALIGRASATDKVASPDWMPGHNERELEEISDRNLSQ